MASDFKKLVFKNVGFQWPKLDQPYRFNTQERRSEPCAPGAQGAAYSVGIHVSAEQAENIKEDIKEHYRDCKARNPKLKPLKKIFGMKELDDGTVNFTAKRNAMNKQGQQNDPPRMINGSKQPIEDRKIFTGSSGAISVLVYPVTSPDGEQGMSLLIDTVQVINAVYGSSDNDFDVVEGSVSKTAPKDDPFGLNNRFSQEASQAASADVLEDEIPF